MLLAAGFWHLAAGDWLLAASNKNKLSVSPIQSSMSVFRFPLSGLQFHFKPTN